MNLLRFLSPYWQCLAAIRRKDREIERLRAEVTRLLNAQERMRRYVNSKGQVPW